MQDHVVVERVTFASKLLEGNPLGDPALREFPVLLPPGYSASGNRYPVLYGLSGYLGKGEQMLNFDPWQPTLAGRLERLYAEGVTPAIVVLPDCFTLLGGNQYINSPALGPYQDYLADELVPFIDREFRTLAGPEARGVFGKSSGGYGALMLGTQRPEVFGAVACHSGDMFFELCYRPEFPTVCNAVNRAGGLEGWWAAFNRKIKKSGEDIAVLSNLALSATYSPDAEGFMGAGLPFDLYTAELIPDVWQRWLDHDPVLLAPRYAENLARLRYLYLECGNRDEYHLHFGARVLSRTLRELGITHDHEEFDDDHRSTGYRYAVSIPRILNALRTS